MSHTLNLYTHNIIWKFMFLSFLPKYNWVKIGFDGKWTFLNARGRCYLDEQAVVFFRAFWYSYWLSVSCFFQATTDLRQFGNLKSAYCRMSNSEMICANRYLVSHTIIPQAELKRMCHLLGLASLITDCDLSECNRNIPTYR